jgi:hypothetical protein
VTNAERFGVIIFRDFRADSKTGLIRWFDGGFSHARTGGFFGTSPTGAHILYTQDREAGKLLHHAAELKSSGPQRGGEGGGEDKRHENTALGPIKR